jgi:hypothetical protein
MAVTNDDVFTANRKALNLTVDDVAELSRDIQPYVTQTQRGVDHGTYPWQHGNDSYQVTWRMKKNDIVLAGITKLKGTGAS